MSKLIALPTLLAAALACSAPDGGGEPRRHEVLLSGAGKLGGCGIGELDERSNGPEVASVGSDGRIHVCRRTGGQWTAEVVDQVPGEQIQLALGEVGPQGQPALISVGVEEGGEDDGGSGIAWMLWRENGAWTRRALLRDSALLHAVAVGDADPGVPGNEVLVAGFTRQVHLVTLTEEGPKSRVIGSLPGNAKGLSFSDGKAYVACDDGSLLRLERGSDGWVTDVLDRRDAPLARLSASDGRVTYCGNDGVLRTWSDGLLGTVYASSDRLRGAVFLGSSKADWVASAGYDHSVRTHSLAESGAGMTLFADTDKLHHLAAGEIDGLPVLVSCGYSGNLVLMRPL